MGGESLHVAGRLLGYRRASTTNRYVHLYDATLGEAVERVALAVGRKLRVNLGDWVKRQLDGITRQDVEDRFNLITGKHGWSAANQTMSMLRSIYRRPFVDHESLRNPVEQWLAAGAASTPSGGGASRVRRRCCRAGIEAMGLEPAIHEVFLIGIYTGMRMGEILSLRWERVDLQKCILRVEETKTGVTLELPITRQLAEILDRRRVAAGDLPADVRDWVFPSPTTARPTMSRTRIISTGPSARPAGRSSGSTGCVTASSPSPSAN